MSVVRLDERACGAPASERNPGIDLDASWVDQVQVNRSAVERRCEALGARRSVKGEWQTAWLLRAITCLDLTTLAGDDTPDRVRRLCVKAKAPVRPDLLESMGARDLPIRAGAVCVYHEMVETALKALAGSGIPVAAVAAGFPAGLSPLPLRIAEIVHSEAAGAEEIDVVISRRHVLTSNWRALYEEVASFRHACGAARLKAILATGELGAAEKVAKAALVAMMAGADFIKTSTGMEAVNATLPASLIMVRQIREYARRTGYRVGFKPAGGISQAKQALVYLGLMKEELGEPWTRPALFRIGASRLLADIERQLEHGLTGRYSAHNRHPLG